MIKENEQLKAENKRLRRLLKKCHNNWLALARIVSGESREMWKEIEREFKNNEH